MNTIYALSDPRTGVVRYVGKAAKLKRRLQNHATPAALKRTRHVAAWLASLKRIGLKPVVTVLELVPDELDWADRERAWIAYYRASGNDLCNICDGGEGGATRFGHRPPQAVIDRLAALGRAKAGKPGHPHTDESKAIISEKAKARWAARKLTGARTIGNDPAAQREAAVKMGHANKGRKLSPEHREKLSRAKMGIKQTPELVERRAAKLRGRKATEEQRRTMSAAKREWWRLRKEKRNGQI